MLQLLVVKVACKVQSLVVYLCNKVLFGSISFRHNYDIAPVKYHLNTILML